MKLTTIVAQFKTFEQFEVALKPFLNIYRYHEGKHTRKHNAVVNIVGVKQAFAVDIVEKFSNNGEQLARLLENNLLLHGVDYEMYTADMFNSVNY